MMNSLDKVLSKTKIRVLFLVLFSCLLYPLSVPNEFFKYGSPFLGFIAFVPVFMALSLSPSRKFSTLMGALFGGITSVLTYYWLKNFGSYTIYTIGGVTLAYILFKAWLFAVIHTLIRYSPKQRPFILAISWAFYEFLKSSGFLAFPWALMPHAVHEILPLIQIVDITGIWGLSFLIALINALIAEIFLQLPHLKIEARRLNLSRQLLVMVVFFFLTLIYGFIRLNIPIPVKKTFDIVMVQQNRDPWRQGARDISLLDAMDLSEQGINEKSEKPDLVAWNETAFDRFIYYFRENKLPESRPFFDFIKEKDIPFLVGAPARIGYTRDIMNATLLLSPQGRILDTYGKIHPVPMVESNPFWDIPPVREFFQKVIGIHGVWTTGKRFTIFKLPLSRGGELKFSTPICFEDSFHYLLREYILHGADLWINMTNVSWSQTDSAEIQMFVSAKFKAIENRRVLLRSTNAGVTSIVDPWGRTLASLPLFEKGYLRYQVPVYKEKNFTAYTLFGDYFAFLLGLFIFLFISTKGLLTYLRPLKAAEFELKARVFYNFTPLSSATPLEHSNKKK